MLIASTSKDLLHDMSCWSGSTPSIQRYVCGNYKEMSYFDWLMGRAIAPMLFCVVTLCGRKKPASTRQSESPNQKIGLIVVRPGPLIFRFQVDRVGWRLPVTQKYMRVSLILFSLPTSTSSAEDHRQGQAIPSGMDTDAYVRNGSWVRRDGAATVEGGGRGRPPRPRATATREVRWRERASLWMVKSTGDFISLWEIDG